jgi:hypothetical protein
MHCFNGSLERPQIQYDIQTPLQFSLCRQLPQKFSGLRRDMRRRISAQQFSAQAA